MSDWYRYNPEEVVQELDSDVANGLTKGEAEQRLIEHGLNELIESGIKSPWRILWEQLTALMVLILIVSAIVSMILGEWADAIVILIIVVLNTILGFSQENRAEKAIAALKRLAVPTVRVHRNGTVAEISARNLVPGDIVLLETGNKISADCRILEGINLQVDESALTGESEPVEKNVKRLNGELPVADRSNMVHMGTVVTYGRGTAIVTETGMRTQLGSIAQMLQTVVREPTPLQRRLDQLGKILAWIILAIIVVVFVLGLVRGDDIRILFLTAISMAVAAIPEGLPAVVTITLALGSRRMLSREALIRKLPAVETLGSVTVICSDKTGTLTENRMQVSILDVSSEHRNFQELIQSNDSHSGKSSPGGEVYSEEENVRLLLKAASLCNDAVLQRAEDGSGVWQAIGDPTEGALLVAAAQIGLLKHDLDQEWPRIAEAQFSSERKRMTTVHRVSASSNGQPGTWNGSPYVAFTKGAVDSLLEVTDYVWIDGQQVPIQTEMYQRIHDSNARLAESGQRVLGVAFKPVEQLPEAMHESELEDSLVFVGLIAMLDPPRPEVRGAVATSRSAGIRPVMITGDHPLTAQHIASQLDITAHAENLTGIDLSGMDDNKLRAVVQQVAVFSRVSPEHKLRIVTALQDNGEVVAMTGDGVNDAPALKKADIGIAMGITGTDVSKEAADMVLLDDNFATIVAAIEEGRVIYDNIRKFIKYILSSNTGEIIVMLVAPFLGMPLPLLPLQILWINLVTDGLPGLALSVEPAERDTMKRPPYHPDESVFSRGFGRQIVWIGILMGLVSLVIGYRQWSIDESGAWQTMVFTTLTLAQMGNALALRSSRDSLFSIGLLSNRLMLGAVLLTFVLQIAVIYVPFLQDVFKTQALSAPELALSLLASTVIFWAAEFEKWILRRLES